MKRSRRIGQIRDLAQRREDELLRTAARLRAALREEEARLAQLQRYRSEYDAQFHELGRRGLQAAMATDFLDFMARLDAAIRAQSGRVQAARAAHAAALEHWRTGHRRTASLDKLADRVRREELQLQEHRAQSESDEAAAGRVRLRDELP